MQNYFDDMFPHATIYGIDIEDKKIYDTEKIKTFICNQENRADLEKFISENNVKFDIILDDGGHTMKQQQISFGFLFKYLRSGGLYILEDLHTSRIENFGTINPEDLITTLDMLYNFKYTGNLISNHITEDERILIQDKVESIEIWTRTPEYNQSVTSII